MDDKNIMMNLNFDYEWVKRNEEEAFEKKCDEIDEKTADFAFLQATKREIRVQSLGWLMNTKNDLKHWKHS